MIIFGQPFSFDVIVESIVVATATISSPMIALWVGGRMRRNSERLDLLRRLIAHSYQMRRASSNSGSQNSNDTIGEFLEIKFWYHDEPRIMKAWMEMRQRVTEGNGWKEIYDLLALLAQKERLQLSRDDLEAGLWRRA